MSNSRVTVTVNGTTSGKIMTTLPTGANNIDWSRATMPGYINVGPIKFYNSDAFKDDCTVCKQFKDVAMVYTPYKDARIICKECTTNMFDKLLGIDNSTEKLLYSKPE